MHINTLKKLLRLRRRYFRIAFAWRKRTWRTAHNNSRLKSRESVYPRCFRRMCPPLSRSYLIDARENILLRSYFVHRQPIFSFNPHSLYERSGVFKKGYIAGMSPFGYPRGSYCHATIKSQCNLDRKVSNKGPESGG